MNPLRFTLQIKPTAQLDMSALTPDRLADKNLAQIKAIKLRYGSKKISVAEAFAVRGRDKQSIQICNSCMQLQHIGQQMSQGQIRISPDAGDFLGQKMSGGHLHVARHGGNWTGNAMSGGQIDIDGNTGDFLGGARSGDRFGMTEGIIVVNGSAGQRVGDKMRRGLIIIHGDTGDFCASRLYAGTIIVLGRVGDHAGLGMRRGSLILRHMPDHVLATFKDNGILQVSFLQLLFSKLIQQGKQFSAFKKYRPYAIRLSGDAAENGKGEMLILNTRR